MGLLDWLTGGWKPRQNMIYKYKRWNQKRHIVKTFPKFQGAGWGKEGWRSQNLSKIYIEIDDSKVLGTFKVSGDTCTIGIVKHKKVYKLYSTSIQNVKFSKKNLGIRSSTQRYYPHVTNSTRKYEYICKVLDPKKLVSENIPSKIVRRRGTAIVDTPKGILVASGRHKLFLLPGGGANKGENREKATIRELKEETGLKTTSCKYLFEYNEPEDGRKIRNLHKVFLIKAEGEPKPNHHDVHHIAYWKPNSGFRLSNTTKLIIDKYIKEFKSRRYPDGK